MARSIELAEPFDPHPNPRVGCVLVASDGSIVGEGAHQGAGTNHAEVHALNDAGPNARGATAYVTLEPCCHTGSTPPCTDALISAGIGGVVVAVIDPDVRVSGSGVDALERAGIDVRIGLLAQEAVALDAEYHRAQQGQATP